MKYVDVKNKLNDKRILTVAAQSMYMPTEEKLNRRAQQYEADMDIAAFACVEEESILGLIILRCTRDSEYEIMSIATDPSHRMQGVATGLITYAASTLGCMRITAETDDDAVKFYGKCGFNIKSLGEKYPGIVRYLCTIQLP